MGRSRRRASPRRPSGAARHRRALERPTGEPPDRLAFEPAPLRYRRDGLTPEKQRDYVEALADCGVAREAAARIGISEQAINRVRRRADAYDFDSACEAAHMFGARRLRSIAFERAVEGTLKGHYYHGELVSEERVYDNRLLTYLLGKTEHLLEPSEQSRAICDHWQPCMDALEQGLPIPELVPPDPDEVDRLIEEEEDPQVWSEEGVLWTFFPPPDGFDGEEEGETAHGDYQRTLTDDELAVVRARRRAANEAELARCCAVRDGYFGLPPRGCAETFFPRRSRNNETSEPSVEAAPDEEDRGEGPIEYKSLVPPRPSPGFRGRMTRPAASPGSSLGGGSSAQAQGSGGGGPFTGLSQDPHLPQLRGGPMGRRQGCVRGTQPGAPFSRRERERVSSPPHPNRTAPASLLMNRREIRSEADTAPPGAAPPFQR
ncbi:MAG TPA: hypothetical protein VF759_10135 [Allosphingosinicella sp.]